MESQQSSIEREKQQINNLRYITVAILAGSFAIITTLLQVDYKVIQESQDLKNAITIFCITIPYLILDIHFLNIEKLDGIREHFIFRFLRIVFWIGSGIGIGYAFNFLPNIFSGNKGVDISNFKIIIISLAVIFALRFLRVFKQEFKGVREERNRN